MRRQRPVFKSRLYCTVLPEGQGLPETTVTTHSTKAVSFSEPELAQLAEIDICSTEHVYVIQGTPVNVARCHFYNDISRLWMFSFGLLHKVRQKFEKPHF